MHSVQGLVLSVECRVSSVWKIGSRGADHCALKKRSEVGGVARNLLSLNRQYPVTDSQTGDARGATERNLIEG